jgi:glyoxylase-like metal-dependent hydrolase (beta-lactamase superfamily II)
MHINWKGKIKDEFYVLGHAAVPVYLLDGQMPVLFDAGFTALSRIYVKEIVQVLDTRSPAFLLLTHAHWDHVGSAAYFKNLWPQMKIGGSSRAGEILKSPGAVEQIRAMNKGAIYDLRKWGTNEIFERPFESFDLDMVLEDRQNIQLETSLSVETIYTPGHTWDFLSYWIPEKKILVASEAAGCDGISEFLVDYNAYLDSLKTLSLLDVDILCTGHNLVLTGDDAKKYITMVEGLLREENNDIDRVVTRVKAVEWDAKPLPRQPEKAYLINTYVRVKLILDHMKNRA